MTITMSDEEVRDLICKHISDKFNVVVSDVYLNVDEESGCFNYAEAELTE